MLESYANEGTLGTELLLQKRDNDSCGKTPLDVIMNAILALVLVIVPSLTGYFASGVAACL